MKLREARQVRILWDATAAPQAVLGPLEAPIRSQEDLERLQPRDAEVVGAGYFYVDVRNMRADLGLMHSTKSGRWEAELIEQDVIGEDELIGAVEAAGGAVDRSGRYPLTDELILRLRDAMGERA